MLLRIALLALVVGVFAANASSQLTDEFPSFDETRTLAEQGDVDAQFDLALRYDDPITAPTSRVAALKWYRIAAGNGVAQAQFNLGVMYANGEGVTENDAEAAEWYRLAARQGLALAQLNLAVMYANGEGVAEDAAEAMRWYLPAMEQSHADAKLSLSAKYVTGDGVPEVLEAPLKRYLVANGKVPVLPNFHQGKRGTGTEGKPEDNVKAVRLYRLAAEHGDERAQWNLGMSYLKGEGIPRNKMLGLMWFNLAKAQRAKQDASMKLFRAALTPAEIAEGERLAAECLARKYKGCAE